MRVGSLCTGYGGLDAAAQVVFGGESAWVSDVDPHVSRLLDARYPGIPNIGDLTAQPDCEPVDIVTAGFPCQPISSAGKGLGVADERWIWPDILTLVGRMDPPPRLLLFENVPRLLTVSGGDAMAQVVEGLAQIGYVGRYRLLRASDVGACHRRNRWFLVASHADGGRRRPSVNGVRAGQPDPHRGVASDSYGGAVRVEPVRQSGGGEASQLGEAGPYLPTPSAWLGRRPAHADIGRRTGFANGHIELTEALALLPTPTAGDSRGRQSTAKNPRSPSPTLNDVAYSDRWGVYAQAIARHEHVLGRPAPEPTADGKLNPVFVEWMQMLPEGWVTNPILELPRTAQLRILGNGVVPAQAAAAFTSLLQGSNLVTAS